MKKTKILLLAIVTLLGCDNETAENAEEITITSPVKPELIVAIGKVEPENDLIKLSAPAGGIIKTVFKKDGDQVVEGEILVQLDDDLEQSKMNELMMQMQSQQSQIRIEKTSLQEVQVNLANKMALRTKTERLFQDGAETRQTLDDLTTEIRVLELKTEESEGRIQLAGNKLNELSARLKTAETEVKKRQFAAPHDGMILDMDVNEGEAINQFSSYAEFAPKGMLIVKAEVDELFQSDIQIGQQVEIVNTGNREPIAIGEINAVGPYLKKKSLFSEKTDDQEDRRVREIRIALKDSDNLIINSKVECIIKL